MARSADGRELALGQPQTVRDALADGGRYRAFPGAVTGMKPPQFAVWMFCQLGARPGDELVDVYPGSGAIGEAWRRYTAAADDTSRVDADACRGASDGLVEGVAGKTSQDVEREIGGLSWKVGKHGRSFLFTRAGAYRVMFHLKRSSRSVGNASVNIQIRPGLRDGQ